MKNSLAGRLSIENRLIGKILCKLCNTHHYRFGINGIQKLPKLFTVPKCIGIACEFAADIPVWDTGKVTVFLGTDK